jgi:hypothetical protein
MGPAVLTWNLNFVSALIHIGGHQRQDAEAKLDGDTVESVHGLLQFDAERCVRMRVCAHGRSALRQAGVRTPVVSADRIDEGTPRYLPTKSSAVEVRFQSLQTRLDVAQAFTRSQMLDREAEKLILTRKAEHSSISPMSIDAAIEFLGGQGIHQLRKDGAPGMHEPSTSAL